MKLSRMDLEEKGAGSPEGLVRLIYKLEADLPFPVPIEELCHKLDISKIAPLEIQGFEGALLTNNERSDGIILINENNSRQRQRFTIAHELGHFLMPFHVVPPEGQFLCSKADLALGEAKEADRRARMEVEANRFAALLLVPPMALRRLRTMRADPDLQHIRELAKNFDVSKEMMARTYATYHEEPIAVLILYQGRIRRCYRDQKRFPFIHVRNGQPVPVQSLLNRSRHLQGVPSERETCDPELWISQPKERRVANLYEQVYLQQNDWALLMLHAELADEDDEAEEEELTERWSVRFARRR